MGGLNYQAKTGWYALPASIFMTRALMRIIPSLQKDITFMPVLLITPNQNMKQANTMENILNTTRNKAQFGTTSRLINETAFEQS